MTDPMPPPHTVGMTKPLTERQEGYALMVAKGATKSDAYRQHYKTEGWSPEAVHREAEKVSRYPGVARRIDELVNRRVVKAEGEFDITVKKLLQTYVEIAFTDPNELTRIRVGACRHCWGVGGAYHWKEHEFEDALRDWQREHDRWSNGGQKGEEPRCPDAAGGFGYRFTAAPNPECLVCEGEGVERMRVMDTTLLSPGAKHLYRGVQQTKEGIKVLFGDKDKALDSIGRMLGAFDDRLRVDLKGQVASLQLTTNDPKEAAMAYERMLTGNG